jgi:hypothetical protein
MLLHGREIAVIVQQGVTMLDAEGADDDVGGFPNGDPQVSESTVILSGAGRQVSVNSETTAYWRNPRSIAIQTELSTRITARSGTARRASRPGRLPSPTLGGR